MTRISQIQTLIRQAEEAAQVAAEATACGRITLAAEQRRRACLLFAQALEMQRVDAKISAVAETPDEVDPAS